MKFSAYTIAVLLVANFLVDATPPLQEDASRHLKKMRGSGDRASPLIKVDPSKEDREARRQEICLDANFDCAEVLAESDCTKPDWDGKKPNADGKKPNADELKERMGDKLGCFCCADVEDLGGPFSDKREEMCLGANFDCAEVLAESNCTKPEWDGKKLDADELKERMGDKLGCFCCADVEDLGGPFSDKRDEMCLGANFDCAEVLAESDCTKPDWDGKKKPDADELKERMGDKLGCFCCADVEDLGGPFSDKREEMCLGANFDCAEVLAESNCTKPEWDGKKLDADELKEFMGDKLGCFCCADVEDLGGPFSDKRDEMCLGANFDCAEVLAESNCTKTEWDGKKPGADGKKPNADGKKKPDADKLKKRTGDNLGCFCCANHDADDENDTTEELTIGSVVASQQKSALGVEGANESSASSYGYFVAITGGFWLTMIMV